LAEACAVAALTGPAEEDVDADAEGGISWGEPVGQSLASCAARAVFDRPFVDVRLRGFDSLRRIFPLM